MSTEIEAKFLVSQHEAYERLRELTSVGRYLLLEGETELVRDVYLDTADRALLSAGYACRRRLKEGTNVVTVKSVAPQRGAVHRREELEVTVPHDAAPGSWPASEAREKVLGLIGERALEELFSLEQTRFVRQVREGDRQVAFASLDEVHLEDGSGRRWCELEVELAPAGTDEDLEEIAGWLRSTFDLRPVSGSKFERGLDAAGPGRPARPRSRQSPAASAETSILLEAPDDFASGLPIDALASMGYRVTSPRQRAEQVTWFDTHDGALRARGFTLAYSRSAGAWRLFHREQLSAEEIGPPSTPPREGGPGWTLHSISPDSPDIAFLDAGLVETEYRVGGFAAQKLLLRAQSWAFTVPREESPPRSLLRLAVSGPSTANTYFCALLQARLGCRPARDDLVERGLSLLGIPAPGAALPSEFRVRPDDTAGRAFERILGGEAWKMRANLRGAVHDLHPEYVHDLRVAARRARSAVRLFSVVSGTEAGGALTEELAWIARLLGAARDLDVFSARLDEQFDRVEADPEFRETIRERLRARRTPAVARLAEALRSERFSSLLHRLESSSGSSEAAGEPAVHFCRRRIQKAFTKLELWIDRPADTLSGSELHRVRILFKRLRYACEFFRPVLGSDAGRLIGSFVGFQDCLGLHQDAVTCLHMLGGVLAETPGEIRSERFLITMGALQQVQRGIQADQRAVFAERWETARELLDVWKKVRDTRGGTV